MKERMLFHSLGSSQRLEPPKRLLGVQKLYFCFVLLVMVMIVPAAWSEILQKAVVITTASDGSSGAHVVVSVDPLGGPRNVQKNLLPTESDLSIAAYGSYFFRLGRYQMDSVTKFHINEPETPIWQFSVLGTDTESANPHDMIFVSDTKAYLLRYGAANAWIVNPSATTEAEFKIGELDLSAYDDGDGKPEMDQGIIVGKKLFILLQRQDSSGGYGNWVLNDAWAAVFDIETDTEIITGKGNDIMHGIPLPARNPHSVQYLRENQMLYVQFAGDLMDKEYSGGIVTVNPDTYETNLILDDGDAENHPYGNFSGMAIVSPEKGYFVGYAKWMDNSLYSFNPSTGAVIGTVANDYLNSKNIAGMESGAYLDKNGMLWVCNSTDGEIVIINPADDSVDEKVSTELNPQKVVFVTMPESSEEWVNINGTVRYEGIPLCAMVLANGQDMFTCDGNGTYEIDVPLDANGKITLFAFCDGLAPFKQVLDPWDATDFDIHMTADPGDSKEITLTKTLETLDSGWVKISGIVSYEDQPLCAMILANGQHIFSDAADGSYEIVVPVDANGEVTLFVFCDGLPPFKQIFKANPSTIAIVNTKGDDEANISVINFRTGETYNDLLSVADSCDLVQYGEDIYIVDKGNDRIIKFDPYDRVPLGEVSIGAGTAPNTILFASDTKAYVPTSDAASITIMNPQTMEVTGTIDISEMADDDGDPDQYNAIIKDNYLFVTLRRSSGKTLTDHSSLAVIDITTDTVVKEVVLETNGVSGMAQDALGGKPSGTTTFPGNLYVHVGCSMTVADDGAIEQIDPKNLISRVILTESVYGGTITIWTFDTNTTGWAIVGLSEEKGGTGFGLRRFNLSAGTFEPVSLFQNMIYTYALDAIEDGLVLVGNKDENHPGILIFDSKDNYAQVFENPIDVGLIPNRILVVR